MPTQLQTFGFTVTLRKLVERSNSYAGGAGSRNKAIDLTRYMGENDNIRTTKSLRQPGGAFNLSIPDQLADGLGDTIYALIEPMDVIEIRASRLPQNYTKQALPLLMRGFVSRVQRSESIGDDGTPQRQVLVSGIDAGKLWQIQQVLYEFLASGTDSFLDTYSMLASLGMNGGLLGAGDYLQKLTDYMNKQVSKLAAISTQTVPPFKLVSTVKQGQAWLASVGSKDGSLWDYAEAFADRPWNELFIMDSEAGPQVIFRPTPYMDLQGKLIMPDAVAPPVVTMSALQLLSLTVSRSDDRVANYFWVPPSDGTLDTGAYLTAAAISNGLGVPKTTPNNDPALYGQKMMRATSSLYSSAAPNLPPTMLEEAQQQPANQQYLAWNQQRAMELQLMNQDNSLLEEGVAVVNGAEQLQIGITFQLKRGTVMSSAYVNQVSHMISPFHSWTTQLGLERGTGFYQRDMATNTNTTSVPFFNEGRDGPYTPSASDAANAAGSPQALAQAGSSAAPAASS